MYASHARFGYIDHCFEQLNVIRKLFVKADIGGVLVLPKICSVDELFAKRDQQLFTAMCR